MIASLRKRFIWIATASAALVVLLFSLMVNAANFVSTDRGLNATLDMISRNEGSIPRHPPKDAGGARGPFTKETPFSTRYFVLRFDQSGHLDGANLSHIAAVTEADTASYVARALRHGPGYGYTGNYKFYVREMGQGRYMAVFLDCYRELHAMWLLAGLSLLADALCIALVYVLVVLLSRKAIDPLVQSAQRQKQFITDASHELKTPLTVIATSLSVLEMEVGQQKWIDKIRGQTGKLTDLVNALVTLSRMDEDEPPLTLTDMDLSELVAGTAEGFRDTLAQGGHALELDVPAGVVYHGDETALTQLVSILLDNAAKYASGDGAVTVRLQRERRGVVLRVGNPCEPMEEAELGKLFDRFYRADQSRAGGNGFGVGLSIARSIVEAHRGTIRAACPQPRRIVFTAVLR